MQNLVSLVLAGGFIYFAVRVILILTGVIQ
jgi:hypothetical protein